MTNSRPSQTYGEPPPPKVVLSPDIIPDVPPEWVVRLYLFLVGWTIGGILMFVILHLSVSWHD